MAERKLKKRFLVISGISKYVKSNAKMLLVIFAILIAFLALYFKPEPEPEPTFLEKIGQSTASMYSGAKEWVADAANGIASGAKNIWGKVTGFFGNLF